MWWPTQARSPLARQKVFFSSAPQASIGRAAATGSRRLVGTNPRERRSTCVVGAPARETTRITESSVRMWIGRSWTRKSVGDRPEPLQCLGVAVGDRLVGDVAAGHHQRPTGVGEEQVVERRVGQHQPELGRARGDRRPRAPRPAAAGRGRSGARGSPSSSASAGPSSTSSARRPEVGDHHRERLLLAVLARAQRRDRLLRVGPAGEVVAAEALDGDDPRPPRSAAAAAATASGAPPRSSSRPSAPSSRARGPQSGQALGWAWKRRSSGSSYSRRQSAHISKPDIVVSGRSYGTPSTIVNRGPQLVQLVNG